MLGTGCAVYVGGFVALAWCESYAQFMGCMAVAGAAAGAWHFFKLLLFAFLFGVFG